MAVISGTRVSSRLVPRDSEDSYYLFDPQYALGSLRSVADTTERDAIPSNRRQVGMLVYVEADDKYYKLTDVDENTYVEFALEPEPLPEPFFEVVDSDGTDVVIQATQIPFSLGVKEGDYDLGDDIYFNIHGTTRFRADYVQIVQITAVDNNAGVELAEEGAGNVPNGTYTYKFVYQSSAGYNTNPSGSTGEIEVVDNATDGKVRIFNIKVHPNPAIAKIRIYRSNDNIDYYYVDEIDNVEEVEGSGVTSYVDNITSPSGLMPETNQTGRLIISNTLDVNRGIKASQYQPKNYVLDVNVDNIYDLSESEKIVVGEYEGILVDGYAYRVLDIYSAEDRDNGNLLTDGGQFGQITRMHSRGMTGVFNASVGHKIEVIPDENDSAYSITAGTWYQLGNEDGGSRKSAMFFTGDFPYIIDALQDVSIRADAMNGLSTKASDMYLVVSDGIDTEDEASRGGDIFVYMSQGNTVTYANARDGVIRPMSSGLPDLRFMPASTGTFKILAVSDTAPDKYLELEHDGTNAVISTNSGLIEVNSTLAMDSSLQTNIGANVSSASDMTILTGGNVFYVTGTTAINGIAEDGWQDGSIVTLIFADIVQVNNGASPSTGFLPILLSGSTAFTTGAGDTLTLVKETGNWKEIARCEL